MSKRIVIIIFLVSLVSSSKIWATEPVVWPDQTFVAPNSSLEFTHIDMDGPIMAVATGNPSIRIFTIGDDGLWSLETTINPDDSDEIMAISLASTRLAVLQKNVGLSVYKRNTSGSWSQEIVEDITAPEKVFLSVDNKVIDTGDDIVVCFDHNGIGKGFQTLDYVFNGVGFEWELSDTEILSNTYSTWGESVNIASGILIVTEKGSDSIFGFDGSCDLYQEVIPGNWSYLQTINPPIGAGVVASEYGSSVSIVNNRLAVGAPAGMNGVSQVSNVILYEQGSFGFWSQTEVVQGEHDRFGYSVLLTDETIIGGSPGFSYDQGYIEIHHFDSNSSSWVHAGSLTMQSQGSLGGGVGMNIAMSGDNIATFDDGGVDFALRSDRDDESPIISALQTIGTFRLNVDSSRFWSSVSGGSIGTDTNWSGPQRDRAIFSLDDEEPVVLLDGTTVFDQIVVRESVTFNLSNTTSDFGDSIASTLPALRINANNPIDLASMSIFGPGNIIFRNDVKIGFNERKGVLSFDDIVDIDILGNLQMEPVGSLNMLVPTTDLTTDDVSVQGSLNVRLLPGVVPQEGDSFDILSSSSVPESGFDAFNLVSLPGLNGNLGFEIEYGSSTAGTDWGIQLNVVALDELIGFGDPNSTTVAGDSVDLDVVDLTGDGIDEICVLVEGSPGQLFIYNMNSSGSVVEQLVISLCDSPVAITSGDLDGDSLGTNDLAILCEDGAVQVLTNDDNDPSNSFVINVFDVGGPVGSDPTSMAAAQVDDSSTGLELVVGMDNGDGTGSIALFSSSPLRGGGFNSSGNQNTSAPVTTIDPSEEEKDQDIPFAAGKSDGKTVVARKISSSSRTSSIEFIEYNAGNGINDQVIRDFDLDGDLDVMITCRLDDTIVLLQQSDIGGFDPPVSLSTGNEPSKITSGDFNGDGDSDLAVITTNQMGSPVVQVFDNSGSFIFTSTEIAQGETPSLVGSGDIDGDGQDDLITLGDGTFLTGFDSSLDIRSLCTCYGDADCNGSVDIEDLLLILGNYGCKTACNADITDDGSVDIEDLLAVIGQWESCSSN